MTHTVRNLHFLSKNSTLISRENCRFFLVWKTRENVVVLDSLAVDNFDFTRKISKKKFGEKLVKMLGFCQNWIFGQKDFYHSVLAMLWNETFLSYFQTLCKNCKVYFQLSLFLLFLGSQKLCSTIFLRPKKARKIWWKTTFSATFWKNAIEQRVDQCAVMASDCLLQELMRNTWEDPWD